MRLQNGAIWLQRAADRLHLAACLLHYAAILPGGRGGLGHRISCLNPPKAKFKEGGGSGGAVLFRCAGVLHAVRAPRHPKTPLMKYIASGTSKKLSMVLCGWSSRVRGGGGEAKPGTARFAKALGVDRVPAPMAP